MRNIILLIFVVANIFFCQAEEFVVRVHPIEHATKKPIHIDRYDLELYKSTPSREIYVDSLVTQNEAGVFELRFDNRPKKKEYWLLIQGTGKDGRKYRAKNLYVTVPKKAKNPYDMDVLLWRTDEYNKFDPAKSFTVIMHTKDSITNEPVDTKCYVLNGTPYQDWQADVKATSENDEITVVFKRRPKDNEEYELLIGSRRYINGKKEHKYVPIKIPKKAKSPYRMPDVLMPGPGIKAD